MQALKVLVVVMGVMIVGGTVTLGVVIFNRMGGGGGGGGGTARSPALTLDEPAGTRIVAMAATADRIAVHLQGGGPDRVVWIDPKSGLVAGRVSLAR